MKQQIDNYFLNINEDDINKHKAIVRKVRIATNAMLIREAKRLFKRGF